MFFAFDTEMERQACESLILRDSPFYPGDEACAQILRGDGGQISRPEIQTEEGGQMAGASDVLSTAQSIVNFLGKVFNTAPGYNLGDFQLKAYPIMLAQAKNTGLPVDCYWFGELVRVMPNGQFGVMGSAASAIEAQNWWIDQGRSVSFYVLACGGPGTPLMSGCSFQLYGAGKSPAGGGSGYNPETLPGVIPWDQLGLVLVVILVGAAVVFSVRKMPARARR